MDVERILQAAPIGLLMALGSYVAMKRRQSGAVRAARDFPALASKLGLSARGGGGGKIGALAGEYEGFRVFVDPDERPRVVAYFNGSPQVVLRTYEYEKRTPPGMAAFGAGEPAVDRFFKDRYADAALARHVREHAAELAKLLEPFTLRWARNVDHLSVTPERVECALQFGRPTHIPPEAAESLLVATAALARFFESWHGPARDAAQVRDEPPSALRDG